jgi:hypothetical protein
MLGLAVLMVLHQKLSCGQIGADRGEDSGDTGAQGPHSSDSAESDQGGKQGVFNQILAAFQRLSFG